MERKEMLKEVLKNEHTKRFYKTNPSGISLIVLVITIIVIIILATAVIISILQNQPMGEASKARFQSDRDNMQSIFTNTVAKVMAQTQGSIKINPGKLNEVTSGVNKTTGVANYEIENGADSNKKSGTIIFTNEKNTENEYYTGKQLPIYKAGETAWYVDSEGILMLEIDEQIFGEGNKEEIGKEEGEKIEVNKDEFNALKLKVTKLEEENAKLKSELEIANNRIKELEIGTGEIAQTAKKFTDKNGSVATIPVGFAIVPEKDVIKDGLVISDVANDVTDVGNQFVWIPVNDINNFRREVGYYKGQIQTSTNWYIDFAKCEEPYSSAKASEKQEYENMINSVKEYKGFYIGRYEMSRSEDGLSKAQSMKNKTPWLNIIWGESMTDIYGGIVDRAKEMYPNRADTRKGEVISTLIYGVAWDETVRFLKTSEEYKNIDKNSTGFGNVGINCDVDGWDRTNSLIQTGSNEKYSLSNIYDMVGNVWEWTMETYNGQSISANIGRIVRGGAYNVSGYNCPISSRQPYGSNSHSEKIGGRIQLYIK